MKDVIYKIGMVGNPIIPEIEWSDEQMEILKDIGFNTVQMNIAWDNRPKNEVLNFEHVEGDAEKELKRREAVLRKHGMKGLPHFGMPRIKILGHEANITPYITPACISDENIIAEECEKVAGFFRRFPTVKDVMIYTYDQHAWLCSEFGGCPLCAGVPLAERLSVFLTKVLDAVKAVADDITVWWQPWELSLGQILATLDNIDRKNLGLMLNTSGLESYFHNFDNTWIKTIGDKAAEKNIPIIGEIQATGSGVGTVELQRFPCPTLVYRQISVLDKLPTLKGIKEHFGIVFSRIGANTLFLKEFFKDPDATLQTLLERTAAYYGSKAAPYLIEAWKECEKAMDLLPYSFTYAYSNIACFKAKHDYNFPKVSCVHADTPAWESDRRCGFFLTHDQQYHPWALENAALLFKQSSAKFLKVIELYKNALEVSEARKEDLTEALSDVTVMYRANMGQYLHFTEALAAVDARTALFQQNKVKFANVCKKFIKLLETDLELNPDDEDVKKEIAAFKEDAKVYFDTRFRQEEHFYGETYVTKVDQRY
ncbi:MAG: hypothetical protein IJR61_08150 [Clostridia bacterium]|nr:hypothetical protein [Clostridia bacterium]